MKQELVVELKRSIFSEIKNLFELRGAEFITEMVSVDPWQMVSNKGRSILENALAEVRFQVSLEMGVYLLGFYTTHSEQAQSMNMTPLHIAARNCSDFDNAVNLLKILVEAKPEWLAVRMTLDGLDMTPVEMVIRTSYREDLMNFMITKYQEKFEISLEEKNKLLAHAKWLSGSGIYSTALIGVRLIERIEASTYN
ncbi:MAG: hypothetical protein K2X08_04515 [Chlamydiales bacterium]|nr:hypothetical protein [Chlamydiales bacterium]